MAARQERVGLRETRVGCDEEMRAVAKEAKEDGSKMRRCGLRVKRAGCDRDGDGKGSDLGGEHRQQHDERAGPREMRVSCDLTRGQWQGRRRRMAAT
jgi:hypothetical protein